MKKKKSKPLCSPTLEDEEPDPCELSLSLPETQSREDQDTILGLIASLHLNSDYSDLTIICKDKIFSAHKLVVCPRSKYFHCACYAGFKETDHPISLNEKDPILIEKLLEFLYMGNYTTPCPTYSSETTQADEGDVPNVDRQPAGDLSRELKAESGATDEADVHIGECFYKTVTESLEKNPGRLMHAPQMNEKSSIIDGGCPGDATEQEDEGRITDPAIDPLVNCHPCYFHVRIYGEADYFMISDLKSKAEKHFCASFMNSPERESFAEIMEEVYSTRANYQELRQLAIKMIVDNLPLLRKRPTPVIMSELMKSVPDFTYDLLQATLDKYVGESSGMEENQSHVRFGY